ncbi:MAG: helicase [Candidatus Latescibacterota bacterium]|nr:MAG: helicase [Candidatus Latescibacterota bacterium]RKY74442.1 MAG: helicase [Candidatus Latescibacterota bacterium]
MDDMRPFVCLHVLGGEVGAVLLEEGKVRDRLRVPSDALPSLEAFVSGRPVVAHSWDLVRGIEDRRTRMGRFGAWRGPVWEVEALARTVRWWAGDYGLGALGVREDDVLSAAEGLASVFSELLDELSSKEPKVLERMAYVAHGTELEEVFLEALRRSAGFPSRIGGRKLEPLKALSPREPSEEVPEEAVEEVLGEGGVCSQRLSGYEHRPQQVLMAKAVCRAFNKGEVILAEAGTGTGKSLAYLVPAVLWCAANDDRTVVSTHTKNLQDQLFFKDIPFLRDALGVPFRAALVKGRGNYLCRRRWERLFRDGLSELSRQERRLLLHLVLWAHETETGDIEEHAGFPRGELWGKLCSEAGSCLGNGCPFYEVCFVTSARRKALGSHIIVVNHSLVFSDLAAEHSVLGDYRNVIFDEAHTLEKVASQHLGRELSPWRLRSAISKLYERGEAESGMLALLGAELKATDVPGRSAILGKIEELIVLCGEVREAGERFFGELAERLPDPGPYGAKVRIRDGRFFEEVLEHLERLLCGLRSLYEGLNVLGGWLEEEKEWRAEIEGARDAVGELAEDLKFTTEVGREDFVYWAELPPGRKEVKLCSAPLDVAPFLEEFYGKMKTVVMTSATLAVGGDFGYMIERLGLGGSQAGRVRTLRVGSPFDYESQVLVCVPTFLPSPKEEGYEEAVEEVLRTLTLEVRRGTLALFTSHRMLRDVHGSLREELGDEGVLLLGQGLDGPRSFLAKRFREEVGSVLLGTDSFWEGVDVPGEALEVLVIVRLPFSVPTEPLVEAKCERLRKEGRDPFWEYSLPEAVIKFRQGFGRLIRHRKDRGVVVVLDGRAVRSKYGRTFLDSLPVGFRKVRSLEELLHLVRGWFEEGPDERRRARALWAQAVGT